MRLILVGAVAAFSMSDLRAQTTLLTENFNGGLPTGYSVEAGSASVTNGALRLTSGCVQIPGVFSRGQGLSIEADVIIYDGGIGDFNIWALADTAPGCHNGPNNGYYLGWYPAGSDNTQDRVWIRTNATETELGVSPTRMVSGRRHRVRADLLANGQLAMYVDGARTITVQNSTYTSGRLFLRSWQTIDIDNLTVRTRNAGRAYGLFVGAYQGLHLATQGFLPNDAHNDAERLRAALDRHMRFAPVSGVPNVMKVDFETASGSREQIESAIRRIGTAMTPDDSLVFYYSGHGATNSRQTQALAVEEDDQIWDLDLEDWLRRYVPSQSRKVVVLESCYSGGFWDELRTVSNISLLAAATTEAVRYPSGPGIYTSHLVDGLVPDATGVALADTDRNGLSFKELHDWTVAQMHFKRPQYAGQLLPVSSILPTRLGQAEWTSVDAQFSGTNVELAGHDGINNAPVADPGADMVVYAAPGTTRAVVLSASYSFDPDGDALSYVWQRNGIVVGGERNIVLTLPVGIHSYTLLVSDGQAVSAPAVLIVAVGTTVQVVVKSEGETPAINPSSNGVVPVTLLGSAQFDVASVDVASINVAGARVIRWAREDSNKDGYVDLKVFVHTSDMKIVPNAPSVALGGWTITGVPFLGTAAIRVVK